MASGPPSSRGHSFASRPHACVFRSEMPQNIVAAQKVCARAFAVLASLARARAPNPKDIRPLTGHSYGEQTETGESDQTRPYRARSSPLPRADLSPTLPHAGPSGGQGVCSPQKRRHGTSFSPNAGHSGTERRCGCDPPASHHGSDSFVTHHVCKMQKKNAFTFFSPPSLTKRPRSLSPHRTK